MRCWWKMCASYGAGLIVGYEILYHESWAQFRGAGPVWAILAGCGTAFVVAFALTFVK